MTGRQPNPTSIENIVSWLMGEEPSTSESLFTPEAASDSEPSDPLEQPPSTEPSSAETIPPIFPSNPSPLETPEPAVPDSLAGSSFSELNPPPPSENAGEERSPTPVSTPAAATPQPMPAAEGEGRSPVGEPQPLPSIAPPSPSPETFIQPGMRPTEPEVALFSVEVPGGTDTEPIPPVPDTGRPVDRPAETPLTSEPAAIPVDQTFLQLLTHYQQQHGEAATQELLSRALIEYEQRNGIPGTNELLRRVMQAIREDEGTAVAASVVSNLAEDLGDVPPMESGAVAIADFPDPEAQRVPPPPVVETNISNVPIPTAAGDSSRQNLLNFLPLALVAAIAGSALAFTLLRRSQQVPFTLFALSGWTEIVPWVEDAIASQIPSPPPSPSPPITEPVEPIEPIQPIEPIEPFDPNPSPLPNPTASPTTLPYPNPDEPLPGVQLW
ncbi:MAG: hypothetical protein IGR76_07600 [Synechococcales cyanobacterium T60_A2020_003]|nr:hypothetical protein [Synechococcales cyanobacterium T60_A2020_003]